jgi:hypothetical protein
MSFLLVPDPLWDKVISRSDVTLEEIDWKVLEVVGASRFPHRR